MNISLAQFIIKELTALGIHSFCLCPGGRAAPFIEILSHSKGLNLFYFFEERSAGFFALGRAYRDRNPVAIICTSGTAVTELLPSITEAYYSSVPLILITADRPLDFGKKGSPQTLKNTINIFKDYCLFSQNISKKSDLDSLNLKVLMKNYPYKRYYEQIKTSKKIAGLSYSNSIHLNVCFDEPLVDKAVKTFHFLKIKKNSFVLKNNFKNNNSEKQFSLFFKKCKKPLILVSSLKKEEQTKIKSLLKNYPNPIYVEALSNLQSDIPSFMSGEPILNYAVKTKQIDGVIRLGGVPRTRFWRDLEKYKLPVLNLSSAPHYSALSRKSFNLPLFFNIDKLKKYLLNLKDFGSALKNIDHIQLEKYLKILKQHPESEEAWFRTIKKSLKSNSKIFLGNSSPIRFWDKMLFYPKKNIHISGQYGVNGIDGLVSRFFGECESKKHNIAILGDLSLLYDMAGFWNSKKIPDWSLIVINNKGGQIFSRLFNNPAFLNSHNLSFKALANLWSLNYKSYKKNHNFKCNKAHTLIEICPTNSDTKACFKKYRALWKI